MSKLKNPKWLATFKRRPKKPYRPMSKASVERVLDEIALRSLRYHGFAQK